MFKQNTPEWLELRKNKIGSSDAPIIMGISPFKTRYRLWEEKLDLVEIPPPSVAMQRGIAMEERGRQEVEKMTGIFFLPQVTFHSSIPWMMASLDGIDPTGKYITEIKWPCKEDHQMAVNKQIPEKYFPQVQHALEVNQVEKCFYASFFLTYDPETKEYIFKEDGKALVEVYRDENYIKQMIEEENIFWDCLQTWTAPEFTDRDYIPKNDPQWNIIATEWRTNNHQLKILEKKDKELRDALIEIADKKNSIGGGIKVTRVLKRGLVDYSAIPALKDENLDLYRKKPTEYYKITSLKDK